MPDPTGPAPMDGRDPLAIVDLEAALRDLATALAIPMPAAAGPEAALDRAAGSDAALDRAPDLARRARLRIEQGAGLPGRRDRLAGWWHGWLSPAPGRRAGRGLALALVALVVLAAVAGAIGLGLPGIRIVPAPATSPGPSATATTGAGSSSPSPSASPGPATPSPTIPGPPGSGLGLGDPIAMADAPAAVDIPIVLPSARGVGAPDAAWLLEGRLSFVWRSSATLPATQEPGIGLILSEFRGSIDPGFFEKILGQGTTIATVKVGGVSGYWISGAPHEIVFVDANGRPVFESRRSVGDTLLWARGDVTYRLESGLDEAAAIALAESLR